MTLFSTIQLAKNALFASQSGIQVVANNIANADTPGYVREKLIQSTAYPSRVGRITMGNGVHVDGVVRQVDQFLQERLRAATSDMANGEAQEKIYIDLESVIQELTDGDLSTALTGFFNSLHDVLNQPEDPAVRHLAVVRGQGLATQFRNLHSQVHGLREMTNDRVRDMGEEINKLVAGIAKLNVQIVEIEEGGRTVSDAVGLRDERDKALADLAEIVDIRVDEQKTGAVNVFVGGNYLVFDGFKQLVEPVTNIDRGLAAVELRLTRTDAVLQASSGELTGLMAARDEILGGFLDQLDAFSGSLIYEFNKIHSSGQGLSGYTQLESGYQVEDRAAALDEAGLPFSPVHGSFQVEIVNKDTGIRTTHDIFVRLNGLDEDTTFESLVGDLDAIDGLSAEITLNGRLRLASESSELDFAFTDDTAGVLAALGVNSFFSGSTASDMGVQQSLLEDSGKLAMSRGGVGHDTANGERMAGMLTAPLESRNGDSLAQVYEKWVGETAQSSSLARAIAEGYRSFQATLEAEHLGLSGVSLDEEAVNMMTYQRSYQAAAKVIATINELLDVLVNL